MKQKDTLVDNFYSFLKTNNLKEYFSNDFVSFKVKETKIIFYYWISEKIIFIHKKDYKDQPHIITTWNYKNDDNNNYYGLCLAMDNNQKTISLKPLDMLKRVIQIVEEKWEDKNLERFNELSILLKANKNWNYFIYNDQLYERKVSNFSIGPIAEPHKCDVKLLKLKFIGQNREKITKFCLKNINDKISLILLTINYKNLKKTFLVSFVEKKLFFHHCDDYSDHALFGRTKKTDVKANFILIGAGSVGAEVVDCLIKSGVNKIEIYDDDNFESHNTPRHLIGGLCLMGGHYLKTILNNKASFLSNFFKSRYPFLNISGYLQKFDFNMIIDENTIVINTTGGTNNNRKVDFNKLFDKNKTIKIIDIFIEPYCAAAHMIVASDKKIINNIFDINWNERCIVKQDKDLRINYDGCFLATLPYAYIPIKVTIPQLVKKTLINKFKNGHYTSFAVELSEIKEELLNKKLIKKIDKKSSGVLEWS